MRQLQFTDCVEIVGEACQPFSGYKQYVSTGAVAINHISNDDIELVDYDGKPSRANLIAKSGDIADGYSDGLLLRAADVVLKERRKLVLVARETPLNLIHLNNMVTLATIGAIIMPPMLTGYKRPETLEDAEMHIVGKIMNEFGLEASGFRRWTGSYAKE